MQIETLKDVLHWTTEFHQHLSRCLAHCQDHNESARAKLLLDYLEQHEAKLARVVEQFEKESSTSALNTWCYEYLDKQPIVPHKHCERPYAKLSTVEIMDVILHQHEQVIELYRYLYAQAGAPSAQDLLQNLIALEEHEAMRMSQDANRLEDI